MPICPSNCSDRGLPLRDVVVDDQVEIVCRVAWRMPHTSIWSHVEAIMNPHNHVVSTREKDLDAEETHAADTTTHKGCYNNSNR